MKNRQYKTGIKSDTVTSVTYSPLYTVTKKDVERHDFSKTKNDRSLWHQTNDKFNVYIEKENPGPGMYKDAVTNKKSSNPISSAFNSKTMKFKDKNPNNNNIS